MRLWVVLLSALGMLGLSSCSLLPSGNSGDLLAAPMMNRQQAEVSQALKATLDLSRINYTYPQSGDYRYPFVFFDMDGDNLDEAIVFYLPEPSSPEARAMVLRQSAPGEWHPFSDISGRGNQVSFVSFDNLLEGRGASLVVGWKNTNISGRSYLGIYSISGDDVSEDLIESYSAEIISDFDGDGLSELVMVQRSGAGYWVKLIKELRGKLLEIDTAPLYYETSDAIQMLQGRVWDGVSRYQAVYIDEEVASSFYATEIFRVEGNELILLAGASDGEEAQPWRNYMETFREQRILSTELQDIIRVPRTEQLPDLGLAGGGEAVQPRLTKYMHFTGEGFAVQFNAVVNAEAGYLLLFPARWIGNVSVQDYPERSEWRFYKVSPDTGRPDGELLRIQVYSVQDYQQSSDDGIDLTTKGIFRYWAYIPPSTQSDPLAITESELLTMFSLLSYI